MDMACVEAADGEGDIQQHFKRCFGSLTEGALMMRSSNSRTAFRRCV